MTPAKPVGLIVLLATELAIALLFALFSWSMTRSLARGRLPTLEDTVALTLPVALVIVCGLFALRIWRAGKRRDAWGLALVPFPLALVVFTVLGAI